MLFQTSNGDGSKSRSTKCRTCEKKFVAAGSTLRAAAKQVGCRERTAYRLAAQPEFQSRLAQLRNEITRAIVDKLTDAALEANETLRALLTDDQPPTVRISAAKTILQNLVPLSERLKPPSDPNELQNLLAQFGANEAAKKTENE